MNARAAAAMNARCVQAVNARGVLAVNARAARAAKVRAAPAATLLALVLVLVAPACRAAPDAARGEQLYARCLACHALAYDRVGPRHCGLFGRLAGSVPGFDYSQAMRRSGIRWSQETLDRFLAAPLATVPGSTMTYAGVPDAAERADLIAYLARASRSEACTRTPG